MSTVCFFSGTLAVPISRETEVAEVFSTVPEDFQNNMAFTLVQFREALADMVGVLREAGDANLFYRDGLELFGQADEPLLPDLLHPNGDGCAPRLHTAFPV